MSAVDLFLAAAILAAAFGLLYRSFRKGSGPCHGCGGCPSGGKAPEPLVTLGGTRARRR